MQSILKSFQAGLGDAYLRYTKYAEDAPGIPDRGKIHELPTIQDPKTWEYGLHEHDAERRGLHYDLRLGDPDTGHAHSWALHAELPKPGERSWAIQQPTHTIKYMDFKGKIEDGYGKGDVALIDRTKTEIRNAQPGHVSFNIYRGQGPEEFTLHQIDGTKWLLYNRTFTRDKLPSFPNRGKYKSTNIDAIDTSNEDELVSAKVDDAGAFFYLPKGQQIRAISTRKPTTRGVIEHTHKIPTLFNTYAPVEVHDTLLRGGIYAKNTESNELGGLLNSNVWKSREGQRDNKLIPLIYDVVRFRGKDVSSAPYADKLEILKKVVQAVPGFQIPHFATTKEEKEKLIRDVKDGMHPETREGVVVWNLNKEGMPPTKAKLVEEHDVFVRDTFPGEGKYRDKGVGGFTYSHTPDGPIAGRVGTGLSDALRKDMHANPSKYLGLVAKVTAQDKFDSGALRVPVFKGWHLDKNESYPSITR